MVRELAIQYITMMVASWIASIAIHELAHILYYRWRIGMFPTVWFEGMAINVGKHREVKRLKPTHRREFYIVGPLAGLLVYVVVPVEVVAVVACIPYLMGCRWDLKRFVE